MNRTNYTKLLFFLVICIIFSNIALAAIDPTKPWHPIQQIAVSDSDTTSMDNDVDGIIDEAKTLTLVVDGDNLKSDIGNSDDGAVLNIKGGAGMYSSIDFYEGASSVWGIGKDTSGNFYIDKIGVTPSALIIDPSRRVGIGTNPGTDTLKVDGTIRATGDICTDASGEKCLGSLTLDDGDWVISGNDLIDGVSGKVIIEAGVYSNDEPFQVKNNDYYFFVGANRDDNNYVDIGAIDNTGVGVWTNLVLNRDGGNVGIGTGGITMPQEKLHVGGKLRVDGNALISGNLEISGTINAAALTEGGSNTLSNDISGKAAKATALAADGTNCPGGQYAVGIDASGNVQSCTADDDSPDSDGEVPNAITISGGTISSSAITLDTTTSTSSGRIAYDAGSDRIVVGDGSALDYFYSGEHNTYGVLVNQGLRISSNNFGLINTCSNNQVLKWDSSGSIWVCADDDNVGSQHLFSTITDGTSNAVADSATDTFKIRGGGIVSVTTTNDDATHGDNVLISASEADPTVQPFLKDGVSWLELVGEPQAEGFKITHPTSNAGALLYIAAAGETCETPLLQLTPTDRLCIMYSPKTPDNDRDGVPDTDDCDPTDNLKWQLLSGYTDFDRDGYGIGSSSNICSGISLPAGYAANDDDCYDSNSNAKPGQTTYFGAHRGDASFDYNCDSAQTKNPTKNCLSTFSQEPGICVTRSVGISGNAGYQSSIPSCGDFGVFEYCWAYQDMSCSSLDIAMSGSCSSGCAYSLDTNSFKIGVIGETVGCR